MQSKIKTELAEKMKKMFFKNESELLLEILDMLKGSLEYLDLSENDLR